MNTVIACGGTGGHLFPGLAVAEVLRERGHEVLLFISEKEIDALAVSNRHEFRFEKLPTIGLPSPFSPAIVRFTQRFTESLGVCRRVYRRFQPRAVLGMGGFTSTAPVLAARLRRVPTFIHESNAIPGKANRLTARIADEVLLGFKECAAAFPGKKVEVTGTPVRSGLKPMDRGAARRKLHLSEDLPTLLVMGGSQGAAGINQAMIKSLGALHDLRLQVIHLAGVKDERLVADNYQRENIAAFAAAFHHNMQEAYSAADLVVARSGAASLSEIALFGLPAILIPFPYATEDHQTRNAEIFTGADAAVLLRESELGSDLLARKIRELISDPARLHRMSENAKKLAPTDAAERVVKAMEKYSNA